MEKDKKDKQELGGLLFVGCLFIGLALGYFFHNIPVGVLGGLGVGFIAMALSRGSKGGG